MKKTKHRSAIARDLRSAKYRARIVRDRTKYQRKEKYRGKTIRREEQA
jgi:hypothetical protein